MGLDEEAKERLADIVKLQPTKNKELQDRWGMDSGSEVHQYLENTLGEYYYRDDDSLIRATAEAAELVDVEPGVPPEEVDGVPETVRVPTLHARILDVLAGPDERSESVVSVLGKLREQFDLDPEAEAVRSALQSLKRKRVVEVEYRTVPTFRLAAPRDEFEVEAMDENSGPNGEAETEASAGDAADETPQEAPESEEEDMLDEIDREFDTLSN